MFIQRRQIPKNTGLSSIIAGPFLVTAISTSSAKHMPQIVLEFNFAIQIIFKILFSEFIYALLALVLLAR
jgi:hypothetical protein